MLRSYGMAESEGYIPGSRIRSLYKTLGLAHTGTTNVNWKREDNCGSTYDLMIDMIMTS